MRQLGCRTYTPISWRARKAAGHKKELFIYFIINNFKKKSQIEAIGLLLHHIQDFVVYTNK
nr:MAG TPA: hypothetical protein [Caudoviricetes sp.]